MYDPGTKQLVWTENATKTLGPSGKQQKNMKNLNKAMQKLLLISPCEFGVDHVRQISKLKHHLTLGPIRGCVALWAFGLVRACDWDRVNQTTSCFSPLISRAPA